MATLEDIQGKHINPLSKRGFPFGILWAMSVSTQEGDGARTDCGTVINVIAEPDSSISIFTDKMDEEIKLGERGEIWWMEDDEGSIVFGNNTSKKQAIFTLSS